MAKDMLSKFHTFDNRRFLVPAIENKHANPKICIICVSAYNFGLLHGEWIDCCDEIHIIQRKIHNMLLRSPVQDAKEWAVYASDGFEYLTLSPYESIEHIHHLALFLTTYGKWSSQLLERYGKDIDSAEEAMATHLQGCFNSELDFAKAFLEKQSSGSIPEIVRQYIDYDLLRKNIFQTDYFSIDADKEVYVFSMT